MSQGYKSGEVTILTPYVGQLLKLRQQLSRYMTVILNERDLDALPDSEVRPPLRSEISTYSIYFFWIIYIP